MSEDTDSEKFTSVMDVPDELESNEQLEGLEFEGCPVMMPTGLEQPVSVGVISEARIGEDVIEVEGVIDSEGVGRVAEKLDSGELKLAGHFLVDFDDDEEVVVEVDELIGAMVVSVE